MSHSDNEENTPLVVEEKKTQKESWKNSIVLRTASFATNGLFFAGHVLLNGKYLSSMGTEGASASALVSSAQAVIVGLSLGCVLPLGLFFGEALGKQEYKAAGDIAKTATVLSGLLGIFAASAMWSTRGIFPLIFEEETAKIAFDFFTGYAPTAIPLLFIIVGPQIAFQEGEWYIPPASMFSVLGISGIFSYLLGFTANLRALGIGLGGTIGSSLSALILGLWFFLRQNYDKYDFFSLSVQGFSKKIKDLLTAGWKLSLQRLTEWGNLFLITTVIGAESNNDLKALNPAMMYLILFGTTMQGCAQAAGMIISKNKGAINKAQESNLPTQESQEIVTACHRNNIKTIIVGNFFGVILNMVIGVSFYLARAPLAHFYLSQESSDDITNLAEKLLWVNMLGLIPDACRIISAGALRGWQDFLYPTIISFIMMTAIGVPVGYGFGKLFNDPPGVMSYIRCLTMLLADIFILLRCFNQVKNDEKKFEAFLLPESKTSLCFSFLKKENDIPTSAINENDPTKSKTSPCNLL